MNAIHGVCCNPAFRRIVIRDTLPGHAACSSQIGALLALRSLPLSRAKYAMLGRLRAAKGLVAIEL